MKTTPTVLVIDDDESVREVMVAILEDSGFRILAAENGTEGLSLAHSGAPSLILCDGCMPGLSGMDVVRRLRATAGTELTPVIMMSGAPIETDPVERTRLSIGFLPKPFTPKELISTINLALS
jgi:sigma-B regulation protein RsbU (phosphoserine phosphatase)